MYQTLCFYNYAGCPGRVWYTLQPPTELNCDPMGDFLHLQCSSQQVNTSHNVTWYWTRCVHDAGVKGKVIEPGDTSDAYGVYMSHYSYHKDSNILFQVTEATMGFYWCEIGNAKNSFFRPSTITPALQPINNSLPVPCTFMRVRNAHLDYVECADESSPTMHTRVPLPSFCPSVKDNIEPFIQYTLVLLCFVGYYSTVTEPCPISKFCSTHLASRM